MENIHVFQTTEQGMLVNDNRVLERFQTLKPEQSRIMFLFVVFSTCMSLWQAENVNLSMS